MKNYILEKDNFLTNEESDQIINNISKKEFIKGEPHCGYIQHIFEDYYPEVSFLKERLFNSYTLYKKEYPEVEYLNYLIIEELRLKHFKPGTVFEGWHSEHCLIQPFRVLNLQIYLSDHKCGTEFYNGKVVLSKKGKLLMWPAYFTHTHRGQKCPENKDRYILSAYINFLRF